MLGQKVRMYEPTFNIVHKRAKKQGSEKKVLERY